MTDQSPATWRDLDDFRADHPERGRVDPLSYGDVFEKSDDGIVPESWELLWFPRTGELIEHRGEAEPGVRLVGRAPHRDYIEAAIEDMDRADRDIAVHRRRWAVTHPEEHAPPAEGWRRRYGGAALRERLAWWERVMEGERVDDADEPVPDWGHTVEHVGEDLRYAAEQWDRLLPNASDAVDEALRLERLVVHSTFNLAKAVNLVGDLHQSVIALQYALVEAYGVAHRVHAGRQAED